MCWSGSYLRVDESVPAWGSTAIGSLCVAPSRVVGAVVPRAMRGSPRRSLRWSLVPATVRFVDAGEITSGREMFARWTWQTQGRIIKPS
ncbi:hypothetical protein MTO96_012595 [Rhipicephalus appendiculatus]